MKLTGRNRKKFEDIKSLIYWSFYLRDSPEIIHKFLFVTYKNTKKMRLV